MTPGVAQADSSEAAAQSQAQPENASSVREISLLAALAATATVVFGVVPGPLLDLATAAGQALLSLV